MNHPFFIDYQERLEDLQRQLHKAMRGLPDQALDWVPGSDMNSLAVLLTHTTGSLRFWIGDVAAGDPSGRVRADEFQTKDQTCAGLLERLDGVFDYAKSALGHLQMQNLDKKITHAPDAKPVTCAWALLHALEHAYQHLGHIEITSQLWKQSRA
jgi:uncharacterized damage-inducible protein DinB